MAALRSKCIALISLALGCGDDGSKGAASPTGGGGPPGPLATYGTTFEGGEFHLGPVDWDESKWHNACAPQTKYASAVRSAEGTFLAGLWAGLPGVSGYCDACIHVTTDRGKSATLRVVTYGDTTKNSIDVSPDAFALLDSGESPRAMKWSFARCPETGKITYEFQTGSSEWWTSFWVRNARVPLKRVEVKSKNHGTFKELTRGGDGTLTDDAGFGKGGFTLQLTGIDDQVYTDVFEWPSAGVAGAMLEGAGNMH